MVYIRTEKGTLLLEESEFAQFSEMKSDKIAQWLDKNSSIASFELCVYYANYIQIKHMVKT